MTSKPLFCPTKLIFCFLAASILSAAESWADPHQSDQKPNIILVFIDDMGWGDFSCFGNTEAETPNIDRLAQEGIAFEQFYVNSPICSPSRALRFRPVNTLSAGDYVLPQQP